MVASIEELESRVNVLDERDSISDRMQNDAITKLTGDVQRVEQGELKNLELITKNSLRVMCVEAEVEALKQETPPSPPSPFLSRKLWVTVLVAAIPYLESLRGTVSPEFAGILSGAIGGAYLLANILQKATAKPV